MHRDAEVVLGLDVGGTSSRALVSDLSGRVLGCGEAAGGNPNSHPADEAVRQIATATLTALRDVDPARVRASVIGMAGVSKMADPQFRELFEREWARLGLDCGLRAISDSEVAFAAGTPEPSGTVLIAGTGAIAARIEQHQLTRTVGGYGWLLGDEGSAYWLGREAVRATLAALDRGDPLHGLTATVREALLPDNPDAQRKQLISAVNSAPAIRLAELAPLVTKASDPTATTIIDHAARVLADTAEQTRTPDDQTPIVLAGSLVAPANPVGEALRSELTSRGFPEPHTAGPGAAGAAWLAALDLTPDPTALHTRLLPA